MATERRDDIVRGFERDYGIDKLPDEEQKVVKQKIASYLSGFGWEVGKMPVTYLRDSLDKAYMGSVGYEKLKEEGKLEGVIASRTNEKGVMGSFGGGAPNTEGGEETLTEKQLEWVKKLKVNPDKAKKTYAERDKEDKREKPEAEVK